MMLFAFYKYAVATTTLFKLSVKVQVVYMYIDGISFYTLAFINYIVAAILL